MTIADLVLKSAETAAQAVALCDKLDPNLAFNTAVQLFLAEEVESRQQSPRIAQATGSPLPFPVRGK